MGLLSRGYYAELLAVNASPEVKRCTQRAGVEIWEWQGKAPADARQTQGLYHAKYAVVDHSVALVGSYNLDPRSERLNSETAIVFEQPALAQQVADLYARDLSTSRQISAAEAATFERPESVRQRFKKELAQLFEGQM